MRTRQRRTMSLEVSETQSETLQSMLAALPSDSVDEPIQGTGKLASLFYHPNSGCRVMALVLSAGFDAVGGRKDNAVKKVDRAIQVFTLVSDDADGRAHLEGLKPQIEDDLSGFLSAVRENVVPYLETRMADVQVVVKPKPQAMPRAIEDGEDMPTERRSGDHDESRMRRAPTHPMMETIPAATQEAAEAADDAGLADAVDADADAADADAAEPAVDEPAAEAAEEEASSDDAEAAEAEADSDSDEVGPSEAEAAAAAAAALAAMEAPYEEVVTDDSPPRFDPDRDLEPDDGRRRRRRSRSPEGLERPRPDQLPQQTSEQASAKAEGGEESGAARNVKVSRDGDAPALAEAGLEALKLALRRARELGLDGRLSVEVTIDTATDRGDSGSGTRRRRRRRRGGRGRSD